MTGHERAFFRNPMSYLYNYEQASDGPECEVITRILAAYPHYRMGEERRSIESTRLLDRTSLLFYEHQYDELGSKERDVVNQCVTKYIEMKGV
jgi:hypothetical protein